jgi:hypothetical protein
MSHKYIRIRTSDIKNLADRPLNARAIRDTFGVDELPDTPPNRETKAKPKPAAAKNPKRMQKSHRSPAKLPQEAQPSQPKAEPPVIPRNLATSPNLHPSGSASASNLRVELEPTNPQLQDNTPKVQDNAPKVQNNAPKVQIPETPDDEIFQKPKYSELLTEW